MHPRANWQTALLAAAMALAGASPAAAQFNRMYLDSTAGRVGYHLSIGFPLTPANDLPRGNKGGAVSGTCGQYTNILGYDGELPPGIKFDAAGDILFSGTPRQPGTWRGSLRIDVYCSGGPDTSHYARSIPVTWQIEP